MHASRMHSALAAAVVAHAALGIAIAIAAHAPRPADVLQIPADAVDELNLDDDAPSAADAPTAPPESQVAPAAAEAPRPTPPRAAVAAARPSRPSAVESQSDAPPGPATPPTSAPSSDARAVSSWRSPGREIDTELALRDAIRAGVRQTIADLPRAPDGASASIRAELNQRDRALGLSPGAPLVGLTRDTVRRSNAPVLGRARFEFRTDERGVVTSVLLLDASSDRTAWSGVAQLLVAAARAQRLSVPRGAHGISVMIDVASALRTASGIDRGQASVSVVSPAATGTVASSRAEQPLRFRVVIGPNQIDATMHQGVGDALHNASMPDQRVVSAQIVDERAF